MALVPLNSPDADKRISQHPMEGETVLLLDALDEDTAAIRDHRVRLLDLMTLTRQYRQVIITCRAQFFPKEEEIVSDTGILKPN
jgi:hypothetical protein